MQLVQIMAGYTAGEADSFRKAIGGEIPPLYIGIYRVHPFNCWETLKLMILIFISFKIVL